MKRLIPILLMLVSLLAFSSDSATLPTVNGRIVFQGVVEVPNASKEELYTRAKLWAANLFKSSPDAIKLDNKPDTLLIKGYDHWEYKTGISFTLRLDFKDGKYRYTLTDFEWSGNFTMPAEEWLKEDGTPKFGRGSQIRNTLNTVDLITNSLFLAMNTPVNSNW